MLAILISVIVGFNVVALAGGLRFIYYFMHKDDYKYNQGLLAQVIAVLGTQLVWLLFSLLPADVHWHVTSDDPYTGLAVGEEIPRSGILYFWQLVTLFLVVYLTLVLPFAVFFYEADSDPRVTKVPPWRQALFWTAGVGAGSWLLIGLLYLIMFKTSVYVERIGCARVDDTNPNECLEFEKIVETKDGHIPFLTCLISIPAFAGWFVLALAGGIGLPGLPITLFMSFVYRARAIPLQQYEKNKKVLGQRAVGMIELLEKLKKKNERCSGKGVKGVRERMKLRNKVGKCRKLVSILEDDYESLELSFQKRGENPIKSYLKLFLGILSVLFSLVWMVEIIVALFLPSFIHSLGPAALDFLGAALREIAVKTKALVIELVLYSILCGYLVVAATYGFILLTNKLKACMPVQPLVKADTHLNAILAHIAIILLVASAVVELTLVSFTKYTQGTDGELIASSGRNHLKIIKSFFKSNVFEWLLLIFALIATIWLILKPRVRTDPNATDPKSRAKWAKLVKDMGLEGTDFEDPEPPPAAPEEPSLGDRAKAKLDRIDQGIANAPNTIMRKAVVG